MKHLLIIALILSSCSPDWHIRRAKFKQPDILTSFNDTIKLKDLRIDTIYYADTFAIVHTVTERDTILETTYLKPDTRYETRWKYKTIRDTVRIKEKYAYKETKQEQKTERKGQRSLWWLWLLPIGAFFGAFIYRWFAKLFEF